MLYWFSIAAITNYYKLSGLEQHRSIILFWRSEVVNRSHQAEVDVLTGCVPLQRLEGRMHFLLTRVVDRL